MINGKKTVAIIPARYASSRFPGKPLIDLSGKTMIERVVNAGLCSKFIDEVYVATDDDRIRTECERIGAKAIMTPSDLPSGTDRIIKAIEFENIEAEYIVNIQGDEPLLKAKYIDDALIKLDASKADVATLMKSISNYNDVLSPNIVKIALDKNNFALYFSRSPIPFARDVDIESATANKVYYKHIGVYIYRNSALARFAKLEESFLEKTEKLEQLRLLEDGAKYLCVEIDGDLIAIDAPEDVEKVLEKLN